MQNVRGDSSALHEGVARLSEGDLDVMLHPHSTDEFGVTDAELRVELVASHLAGLAFARYQLKLEPIASTPVEDVVAWMGPTLQRYLTGD